MLAESILVDLGFVNPDSLTTIRRRLRRGAASPPLLYDMLAVEVGLRSMTSQMNTPHTTRMLT